MNNNNAASSRKKKECVDNTKKRKRKKKSKRKMHRTTDMLNIGTYVCALVRTTACFNSYELFSMYVRRYSKQCKSIRGKLFFLLSCLLHCICLAYPPPPIGSLFSELSIKTGSENNCLFSRPFLKIDSFFLQSFIFRTSSDRLSRPAIVVQFCQILSQY